MPSAVPPAVPPSTATSWQWTSRLHLRPLPAAATSRQCSELYGSSLQLLRLPTSLTASAIVGIDWTTSIGQWLARTHPACSAQRLVMTGPTGSAHRLAMTHLACSAGPLLLCAFDALPRMLPTMQVPRCDHPQLRLRPSASPSYASEPSIDCDFSPAPAGTSARTLACLVSGSTGTATQTPIA